MVVVMTIKSYIPQLSSVGTTGEQKPGGGGCDVNAPCFSLIRNIEAGCGAACSDD